MRAEFDAREIDRYDLHTRHLNHQMVRVLKTIGFDARFTRGLGAYLWDAQGARYLDLVSGWGVFAVGRNHPHVAAALKSVLDADLPNLVQMDVSPLAGALAERLLKRAPWLRQGVLRQFRRRGGGGFDQVRSRGDGAGGDRALRALVPRPHLWRAVGGRRAALSRRLRAGAARLPRNPVRRSRRAGAGVARGATSPRSWSSRSRARSCGRPRRLSAARRRRSAANTGR